MIWQLPCWHVAGYCDLFEAARCVKRVKTENDEVDCEAPKSTEEHRRVPKSAEERRRAPKKH